MVTVSSSSFDIAAVYRDLTAVCHDGRAVDLLVGIAIIGDLGEQVCLFVLIQIEGMDHPDLAVSARLDIGVADSQLGTRIHTEHVTDCGICIVGTAKEIGTVVHPAVIPNLRIVPGGVCDRKITALAEIKEGKRVILITVSFRIVTIVKIDVVFVVNVVSVKLEELFTRSHNALRHFGLSDGVKTVFAGFILATVKIFDGRFMRDILGEFVVGRGSYVLFHLLDQLIHRADEDWILRAFAGSAAGCRYRYGNYPCNDRQR